jgi:hypothetical protein
MGSGRTAARLFCSRRHVATSAGNADLLCLISSLRTYSRAPHAICAIIRSAIAKWRCALSLISETLLGQLRYSSLALNPKRPEGKMAEAKQTNKWSNEVTKHSDALDLEKSVFKGTATDIARSLKRSAEASHRRKSGPFRSAMSMLVFYINRAGRNLPQRRRRTLETAKDKLRQAFGRKG